MPSPIGHALAGVAVAWIADAIPGTHDVPLGRPPSPSLWDQLGGSLTMTCAALAAAPDLDLLWGAHRTITHSVFAVACVAVAAGVWAARSNRPVARLTIVCAAAWASHLLLDWMAADGSPPRGIQLLWPFAHGWFISGWDIFAGTERRRITSLFSIRKNLVALAIELSVFVPLLLALWLVRVKALAGFSTELARSDHSTQ